MGWSSSWIAIQGASKADVLGRLDLLETDRSVFPGSRSAELSLSERPEGWLILFSEDFDWGSPERTRELSEFGLAVGCQFEDKVEMTSSASAARNGVELWRVFHKNGPTPYRLDVTGEPPEELEEIRKAAFEAQDEEGGEEADVDWIHDVPLDVARAVCGFRADEVDQPFIALSSAGAATLMERPPQKGLLAKLLAPLMRGNAG